VLSLIFFSVTGTSNYIGVGVIGTEYEDDLKGSNIAIVTNGTTLRVAAGKVKGSNMNIYKSENNGKDWNLIQEIDCCPNTPQFSDQFSASFSDNGNLLLIGNQESIGGDPNFLGASLYNYNYVNFQYHHLMYI
jgi:hypothetical protein